MRPHRWGAQSLKTVLTSDAIVSSRFCPVLVADSLHIRVSMTSCLGSVNLLEQLSELRGAFSIQLPFATKDPFKGRKDQPDQETHTARDLEGLRTQERGSPRSWGWPPSKHRDTSLFNSQEAL